VCYIEAAGSCAEPEEASVGDAEGLRADAKASVVVQRLAELMHGQELVLAGFVWARLGASEPDRVMQSLSE